jgi:hypothetical protein
LSAMIFKCPSVSISRFSASTCVHQQHIIRLQSYSCVKTAVATCVGSRMLCYAGQQMCSWFKRKWLPI